MQSNYLDAFMSGDGNLRVITACPFCDSQYSVRAARVIARRDDAHIIHIECAQCGGSIVALVLANGDPHSVGIMTDLRGNEVEKFSRGVAVTSDDAIALHVLLQDESSISPFI